MKCHDSILLNLASKLILNCGGSGLILDQGLAHCAGRSYSFFRSQLAPVDHPSPTPPSPMTFLPVLSLCSVVFGPPRKVNWTKIWLRQMRLNLCIYWGISRKTGMFDSD